MEESNNSGIFRKSSLDSISAPEQLNDYIRVIGPSVWVVLIAIIIMLLGIIIWGVFGRLNTAAKTVAFVDDSLVICYVNQDVANEVDKSDVMYVGGQNAKIESVSTVPVQASGVYDAQTLEDLGLSGYEMLFAVTAKANVPNGSYSSEIIVEQIRPLSFITGEDNQNGKK